MASALINNLYPPIMDTYMPAFDREKSFKIYFDLSSFNDREDINNYAQIQIRYQQNNKSALDSKLYPAGIALLPIYFDKKENRYCVQLSKKSFQNSRIELNVYYKVQIRFMTTEVEVPQKNNNAIQQKYVWFNESENLIKFSEWSKICLIRGIATPDFTFNSFEVYNNKSSETVVINNRSFSDLVGKMSFTNLQSGEKESDSLKSYEVYIYKREDLTKVLFDSKIQYPQATNEINQKIKYLFEDETYYRIAVEILTVANYSNTLYLDFYVSSQYKENDKIIDECKIKCVLDSEEGRIKVELTNLDKLITSTFNGRLVFRRSSQDNDFSYWEDIQLFYNEDLHKMIAGGVTDLVWYDYTIESGKLYQYAVQKIVYEGSEEKRRGPLKMDENYRAIWDLDDAFLTTYNAQLKIKFNPQVSNFSKTVSENKVDTIGSKYPFFYRNAKVGYRTFSISGLIHSLIDENYIFLNKNDYIMKLSDEVLEEESFFPHNDLESSFEKSTDLNQKKIYGKYLDNIRLSAGGEIDNYRDYNYEKEFRERVIDFLTDGKPKLFKSPTEGNILVRLMNISFTPNQTLGRLVYSFSATAYEIDEYNLDNCFTYNIHRLKYDNDYYKDIKYIDSDLKIIGELIFNTENVTDIYNTLKNKYNFRKSFIENDNEVIYQYSLNTIDWICVSFPTTSSKNELGVDESSLLYNSINGIGTEANKEYPLYIGHIININGQDIVIPQYREYCISKNDLQDGFTSIDAIIDENETNKNIKVLYKLTLSRIMISSTSISEKINQKYLRMGVGQLWGAIDSDTEIIERIKLIYKKETQNEYSRVTKVKRLYLEGNPGAYFTRIRGNGEIESYTLNSSGQLDLSYGEESLDNFTFKGFKLYKAKNPIQMHEQEYYIYSEKQYNNIKDITRPKNNYVYNIDNVQKIYYLGHWCDFESISENEGIAKYKDEVIIYYFYNLQKGELPQ